MSEQRQDPIPEVEWESIREPFRELYIDEKKTLGECMQLLQSEYGFPRGPYRATERMFKTRISKWGYDVKKIRHQVWESMYAKYHERRHNEGKETWFEAMVSGDPKVITYADIKKQFRRRDPNKPSNLDEARILELLRRADLRFYTPPGSPRLRPQSRDESLFVNAGTGSAGGSPPRDRTAAQMPIQPVDLPRTEPWTASLPPIVGDYNGQLPRLPPILPPESARQQRPEILQTWTEDTPPRSDSDEESVLDLSERFSRTMSFDPVSTADVRQRFSQYTGISAVAREPSPDSHYDREDYLVGQWGYHHMLACIYSDNEAVSAQHRHIATTSFQTILQHAHKFILPGLNWMTSTLLAISREMYKSFLDESIEVIDRLQGDNLMYGHLYKYARAVFEENNQEIDRLGAMFGQTRAQFQLIFGPTESMNILVLDYYCVWHLLAKSRHQEAFPSMRHLLLTSEKIAGPNDPLTINCLAMIARAYTEVNECEEGLRYLIDACHRSEVKYDHQNPFRLKLIHSLANLQQRVGNFAEAERCLREVLKSRTEVLGIRNKYTWGSVESLRRFLISQNREQEAGDLWTEMECSWQLDDAARKARNPGIQITDASDVTQNLRIYLSYHGRDEGDAFIDSQSPVGSI